MCLTFKHLFRYQNQKKDYAFLMLLKYSQVGLIVEFYKANNALYFQKSPRDIKRLNLFYVKD